MQPCASLTDRILEFQRTGRDGEAIVREVAAKVYEYPRRKCRWDEDSSSEFFTRVFPKIRGMIERFRYVGRPFESYLASTLMYQIRTFAQAERCRELEWQLSACPALTLDGTEPPAAPLPPGSAQPAARLWAILDPPLRQALGIGEDGRIACPTARKRFLILCLKCAHLWDDGDVAEIARIAGWPVEELSARVERLGERRRRKLERAELYTGRRNRAYYGLRLLEARLSREPDPDRRATLERRSARLEATVRACQGILARMQLGPTHREIAAVLGIPKPTVDSAIHRLKRKAARLYALRHALYA